MQRSIRNKMLKHGILIGLMLLQQMSTTQAVAYDDPCTTKSQPGLCKVWNDCPIIKTLIDRGEYKKNEVLSCGFLTREELICCPTVQTEVKIEQTTIKTEPNTFVIPNPTTSVDPQNRPTARACRRIEKGLIASLTTHILGGTPAELGEFPHMAAIGYSRIGDAGNGPYDIRCGGSLIDSRYVLTAAHCVAFKDSEPSIVRLGIVNFTDPEQISEAVEIRIMKYHIHDDYSTRSTYNDIAILELERAPELGRYIYPICLYSDVNDPGSDAKLWVTGWGTVNTSTRAYSDILLKARLNIQPLESCNKSFVDYGLTRQVEQGIIRTQICAADRGQVRDACQGDSGGPLNMIVDESKNNYRLVGVISSGFGCASSIPGLYTRVAAFLDFIERIVWPNGGD